MLRLITLSFAILSLANALLTPAKAEEYPSRLVTVIVSQTPGGLSDIFTRIFTQELQTKLGQTFIVENRGGANGLNGARTCAQAKPDGYTLCVLSSDPLVWNALMFASLPFDPEKSFQPISNLFFISVLLGVHPSLKVKTLSELVAYSKTNAGKVSYATASSISTLFVEQIKRDTGADMVGVPFKGGGEAANSVLSGHTQVGLFGLSNFSPYLGNQLIIPIAIDGEKRLKNFPDIPTFKESGYNGERSRSWFGLFAPAGTPPDIVKKLNDAFTEIGSRPEIQEKAFYLRGLEPALTSAEDFAKYIESDRAIAKRIVKAAGVVPQ